MPEYSFVYQGKRRRLTLGRQLGEGASGKVYLLPGVRGRAVKIYHDRKEADDYREKVALMLAHRPNLAPIEHKGRKLHQIAWPEYALDDPAGAFAGFMMPEIDFTLSHPLEHILQKNSRRAEKLPERYDFRFALAANLAALFGELHALGHYMIDMKPDNLRMYPETGYLAVVDTDGFSIKGGAKRIASAQFTDGYIAPEGKGRAPGDMEVDQDRFALAVIIFQLLNNGVHPYSFRPKPEQKLPSDTQQRIFAGLYPYGVQPRAQLEPARVSIHQSLAPETRLMFDRAFTGAGSRPSATEWRDHLKDLRTTGRLVKCAVKPAEHSHFGLGCGLCAYEKMVDAGKRAKRRPAVTASPRPPASVRVMTVRPPPLRSGASPAAVAPRPMTRAKWSMAAGGAGLLIAVTFVMSQLGGVRPTDLGAAQANLPVVEPGAGTVPGGSAQGQPPVVGAGPAPVTDIERAEAVLRFTVRDTIVRAAPNDAAGAVGRLPRDATLYGVRTSARDAVQGWLKITEGGFAGYYVAGSDNMSQIPRPPLDASFAGMKRVSQPGYLYAEPDRSSAVLAAAQSGQTLQVTGGVVDNLVEVSLHTGQIAYADRALFAR